MNRQEEAVVVGDFETEQKNANFWSISMPLPSPLIHPSIIPSYTKVSYDSTVSTPSDAKWTEDDVSEDAADEKDRYVLSSSGASSVCMTIPSMVERKVKTLWSSFKVTRVAARPDTPVEEGYFSFLRQIIKSSPEIDRPIMLLDANMVLYQAYRWFHHLPRVQPHYAVKCNPDPVLCGTLHAVGVKFDVASVAEMDLLSALKCSPQDWIYANPCKVMSGIRRAATLGVNQLVFDNLEELVKIQRFHPKAHLFLRLRTDDSASRCPMSAKYGAPPEVWSALLLEAQRLQLNVVGACFHVGSGCTRIGAFSKAIASARALFDLAESLGRPLTHLDIGGGFPGRLPSLECFGQVTFDAVAEEINQALIDNFPVANFPNLQILAEPGRFFAAACCTLAVQVQSRRAPLPGCSNVEVFEDIEEVEAREEVEKEQLTARKFLYYINDGLYGSFNCIKFDHASPELEPLVPRDCTEALHACAVFGPTCDGIDCVHKCAFLPEMQVGDWLAAKEMGAYTICAASAFNGFEKPLVVYCQVSDR
eukprot:Platyproteum_vivax@DN5431_c0_g1_i1.p1